MLAKIKFILKNISWALHIYSILSDPRFETERLKGEIIRNTHSIEKGLSLEKTKKGFGAKKIIEAYTLINKFIELNPVTFKNEDCIKMFISSLNAYLAFHASVNYKTDVILKVEDIYNDLLKKVDFKDNDSFGGVLNITRTNYSKQDQEVLSNIIKNRHSIREFDHTPVDENNLTKAIELALHCPSACNRQCHRVYVVSKSDFMKLDNVLSGTGGFSDDLDKILFITGKLSLYRTSEPHQWSVTSSIFASYLSLTLEAYNIGCCFIQRPLFHDKKWNNLQKKLGVPLDEQLICCLGIGNFKKEYKVPVSHRYNYDLIVRKVSL